MNSPIRLMLVTTVPVTLSTFFQRQVRRLVQEGFEIHTVSSPGTMLETFGSKCGVMTYAVEMERRPDPVRDTVSLARLYQLMRRIRPQVVHAHTPKAGFLGMVAAKAACIPTRLYTVHGLPLLTRSGPLRRILKVAERTSVMLSTRTYAVSDSVRRILIEEDLASAKKVKVLGDGSCAGIDVARFCPATATEKQSIRRALGLPLHASVICFLGRLSRDKGIGVLADSWRKVGAIASDTHLLLVGDEDATDPVPASVLDYLRLHDRVHMIGALPAQRVRDVYAASDICVLPTFREGLSQVTLEAGCMALPMAATRVSGLDAVVDGVTGLLAAPGDSDALADILIQLVRNPEMRTLLGLAAAQRVRSLFSDERVNRLWMSEYHQLVCKPLPNSVKVSATAQV